MPLHLLPLHRVPENAVLGGDIIDSHNRLLFSSGTKLTADCLKLLRQYQVESIYIQQERNMDSKNGDKNIEILNTTVVDERLKASLLSDVESIFKDDVSVSLNFEKMQGTIDSIVDKALTQRNIVLALNNTFDKQYNVFLHSVNVSLFSILIGMAMELPKSDLCLLGMGGLLHDFGKIFIAPDILNKPGKHTQSEYELVKKHETIGYNAFRKDSTLDHRILLMILQHHERCDGKGYPWGITEKQIHPLSKILAVANVYEALTANRMYRDKFHSDRAIKLINEGIHSHFSLDAVTAFNSIVVPYNIGATVKLSNGLNGKVVKLNSLDLYRPHVFTPEGKLNLINNPTLSIVGIV